MMKFHSSSNSGRRGSALLIVLGMLSFMIVSAVAFSVYMRMSRAPSSFLRRNIATSNLVKAALARAIEDIDNKIGNDIYPGVGVNATDLRSYTADDQWYYKNGYEDAWINRIFCPYSNNNGDTEVNKTGNRHSNDSSILDFNDTAAVIPLEGLGYIPAPLVNQARYWSRRSMTARWKRFNYDLGRWAYTAINVSDLLDINTLRAFTNRNSGAFGRLSLSAAVKNAGGTPQAFDNFVKNRGGTESQVPLTSVMDMNLALRNSGPVKSPFYDWITKGGNNGFYGNSQSNQIAPLVFMTDSWYPTTNAFRKGYNPNNDQTYYLSRPEDQPFLKFNNTQGMLAFFRTGNPAGAGDSLLNLFAPQIRAAGVACLYDYLDKDSVPTSLVLPCTEQAPMMIGVCPIVRNLQFSIIDNVTPPAPGASPLVTTHDLKIQLDSVTVNMNSSLLFPFKRLDASRQPGQYRLQALARIYLGPDNMPLRASDNNSKLHPDPLPATWTAGTRYDDATKIYTIVSSLQNIQLPNASDLKNGNQEKAIINMPLLSFNGSYPTPVPLFTWTHTVTLPTPGGPPPPAPADAVTRFDFTPYSVNGTTVAWGGTSFSGLGGKILPNVAVWVRVVDEDNKTVDLVPATLQDDNLNWSLGLTPGMAASLGGSICGTGVPLFNFKTKQTSGAYPILDNNDQLLINWAGLNILTPNAPVPGVGELDGTDYSALYCYDPRYNFAPEDWYSTTDKGVDYNKWLNDVEDKLLGQEGRDSDIFMFVSNQEYLQSMGELTFLPRTQDLVWNDAGGGIIAGTFFNVGRYDGASFTFASRSGFNPGTAANRAFFWRTYRAYAHDNLAADPIYNFRDSAGYGIFDDDGRGPRVNPYTEDAENVFLAAIADTPEDYWAASTNTSQNIQDQANGFNKNPSDALKHCFNNDSPLSRVTDQEIRQIASIIRTKIRSGGADWLAAYNDLDWYGNGDPQAFLQEAQNITQTAINEVDRKFLYSFWRGCFGNRQQLFIVFVRAEPSVLGGAQQGGRAVALVWRDPAAPEGYANHPYSNRQKEINDGKDTNMLPPHRTRVLFYHQFE